MNEKTISSHPVFDGRLLKLDVLEVALDNGRRARREIVRHPGAVAIWARAPDGRFVFVRQFRKAIEQELLEVVAGTLEIGETPEACARREIREETGYAVKTLTLLGSIFTAPGFCTERIAVFYAELAGGGVSAPDPDEHLDVVLLDEADWKAMMSRGAVQDAKTWAAWGMLQTRGSEIGQLAKENVEHPTSNVQRRIKKERKVKNKELIAD
ncbi:MAG: NUDIX hydrolase [Verrucomicrobia bacterium]|nr:NUDIX hydrolase [Verrucomicrobiota bacterium]MBU1736101.1 NUDIX hydrolase [Verrucomicrobiota bacterium]MBU1857065.1 NUDIX hydrolase [Verrucomicrobiota bacterium]